MFPRRKYLDVTILTGTDHADLWLHREFRVGKDGEPMAVGCRWEEENKIKGKAPVIFF